MYSKQPPTLDSVGVCSTLRARYVNISCQGVAFCDPPFRYGNDIKLHFEETEK